MTETILAQQVTARKTKKDLWSLVLVIAVSIVLAARFFRLISRYAVNIFFYDQWDFNNATLFESHSLLEMFRWQHGPHRQGLGALLARLVEPHFSWSSRSESFLVGGIIVIAVCCALWLKKRLYGSFSLADAVIPLVFFTPLQYESLFVTTNLAHGPLPLLLIILYCLAWTCSNATLRYGLVLVTNFVTIYTGFGFFIGFLTPLLLTLDYRASARNSQAFRRYFVVMILAVASLGSFFVNYKFQAAVDCFSFRLLRPLDYLWFVDLMWATLFGAKGTDSLSKTVGTIVLIIVLVSLARIAWRLLTASPSTPEWRRNFVAATLIAYSLLFCINTAFGRLCSGLGLALFSRYVNYVELGILGLYFSLLTVRSRLAVHILTAVLLVLLSIGSIPIIPTERYRMRAAAEGKRNWRDCYLRISNIEACNLATGRSIYPPDGPGSQQLKAKLDYLKKTKQNLYSDAR